MMDIATKRHQRIVYIYKKVIHLKHIYICKFVPNVQASGNGGTENFLIQCEEEILRRASLNSRGGQHEPWRVGGCEAV